MRPFGLRLLMEVVSTAALCAVVANAQTLPNDDYGACHFVELRATSFAVFNEVGSPLVTNADFLIVSDASLAPILMSASGALAEDRSSISSVAASETSIETAQWTDAGLTDPSVGYGNAPVAEEPSPNRSLATFVGYDSWRGIQDGGWTNNGIHLGLNYGTRLGRLSDRAGIGFQAGATLGVYDWSGTDYRIDNQNQAEIQGFITYGLFRRASEDSNWSACLVQDWMVNQTFSVFAQNPTLAQVRYQWGYATSVANEYGIWGAWREQGDTRTIDGFGPVTWRPLNQINAYWHRKWAPGGADTWLWFGVPERTRLSDGGSLGDYLAGTFANYPLNDRLAIYSQITYMHPSASAGPAGSREEAWNFFIGLSFSPARNTRTNTVAGQRWTPQLPVANNGTFLVDASQTY